MWRKEGLNEPDAIRNANNEYRMDMDVVGTFVNECLEIDASLKWRLNNTMLYRAYMKWCSKNNEHLQSQKRLTMRMSEKGFKRLHINGERVLRMITRNYYIFITTKSQT